jgi:hypothetical protein
LTRWRDAKARVLSGSEVLKILPKFEALSQRASHIKVRRYRA